MTKSFFFGASGSAGASPPPPPPPGPPVWLPQAPSGDYAKAFAGPKDDHYWDGSASVAVGGVWVQNTDWGNFNAGTEISASGLRSGSSSAPVLTTAAAADLLAGYTATIAFAITTDAAGQYNIDPELLDLPNYNSEWAVQLFFDQTGTPPAESALEALDAINGVEYKAIDPVSGDGAHKIAFTFLPGSKISYSLDGAAIVQTDAATPANSSAFTNVALAWRTYAGAVSYVTAVAYWTPQPNADLPTLSGA